MIFCIVRNAIGCYDFVLIGPKSFWNFLNNLRPDQNLWPGQNNSSKVWALGRHPNKDVTLVEFKCPLTFCRSQIISELFKKFKGRPKSFGLVQIILSDQKIQAQTKNFLSGPKNFVQEEKLFSILSFTIWPMTKCFYPTQRAQKSSAIIEGQEKKDISIVCQSY